MNKINNKTYLPLVSAAALAFLLGASAARAETTVSKTVTESPAPDGAYKKTVTETTPSSMTVTTTTQPPPAGIPGATTTTRTEWMSEERTIPSAAREIKFADFDLNHDGILSRDEVARMLFKLYDTDGNEVIDNVEYERPAVVTIVPMEKTTKITYDFDGDGVPDKTQYTYETFMKKTLLSHLDKNKDGLSPHEFTGRYFLEADVNHDKAIDFKEWQGSYNARIDKMNKEDAQFNK